MHTRCSPLQRKSLPSPVRQPGPASSLQGRHARPTPLNAWPLFPHVAGWTHFPCPAPGETRHDGKPACNAKMEPPLAPADPSRVTRFIAAPPFPVDISTSQSTLITLSEPLGSDSNFPRTQSLSFLSFFLPFFLSHTLFFFSPPRPPSLLWTPPVS